MPYKNFEQILSLTEHCELVVVGKDYDMPKDGNRTLIDGYVQDDLYYSIMSSVKAVVILHSRISFSGILADAMNLKKIIVGNELVRSQIIDYENFVHFENFNCKDFLATEVVPIRGMQSTWHFYRRRILFLKDSFGL